MNILIAALLGIIQGLTEFLPVSSTGHLILAQRLFGVSQERFGLTFDAALHIGTLVAALWYFRSDVAKMLRGRAAGLVGLLMLALVPAAVFGILLEDKVETVFRSPLVVAGSLIAGSMVFLAAEWKGKQKRTFDQIRVGDAVVLGIAQVLALVPGISRSGITIAAGLSRQVHRDATARFSFLMAIPLFAGAGAKRLLEADMMSLTFQDVLFFAVGTVSAAVSGYIVIAFLMRYLSRHSLVPFVWYRLGLAAVILLFLWR